MNEAKKKYEVGNFDDVFNILNTCIKSGGFSDLEKVQAYRLISLSYLALDSTQNAIIAANQLLKIYPGFETNLFDPPAFIRIINDIKQIGSSVLVTSVSKKAENIRDAPATVIVIDENEIKRRGYQDLEAVIHDLPGFDISRSNGNLYSHLYQRGYRSINTNRTLFLINGVEENDLWSSNVYISRQYPMSNIKSVEVVYGPASTMYGSNAFLGVINVNTKQPEDFIKQGNDVGVDAQVGYGSWNTKYIDATFAAKVPGEKIAFSFTGRYFFSNEQSLKNYPEYDYAPLELTEGLANTYRSKLGIKGATKVADFLTKFPNPSSYYTVAGDSAIQLTDQGVGRALELDNLVYANTHFSDRTAAFAIDAKVQLYDFTLGWAYWYKAEGPGAQYTDVDYGGADQGQSWAPVHNYFYAKYEKNIHKNLNISDIVTYKIHDLDKDNRIVRFRDYRYSTGRKYSLANLINGDIPRWDSTYLFQISNQLRNELKILWTPSPRLDMVIGFEARFSTIQGDYSMSLGDNAEEAGAPLTNIPGGNQFFSRDLGVFAEASYRLFNDFTFTGGLRYDNNRIRQDQGYGDVFNPRLALVYTPGDLVFKAIYAEAFKDATNREKYSTAAGKRELPNPGLQPEKVKNFEVELGANIIENLFANVVPYYSLYSNIIQEMEVDYNGGKTNQNQASGKMEVFGVQATANYKYKNIEVYGNYTFTQPNSIDPKDSKGNPLKDENGNDIKKLRVSDIADHQVNLGINYLFFESLNVNLRMNYVGTRKVGQGTTVPTNTANFDPYAVFFGSVSYTYQPLDLTIQCTVNNILDLEYFSPGLEDATGSVSSMLPQNRRNFIVRLIYHI